MAASRRRAADGVGHRLDGGGVEILQRRDVGQDRVEIAGHPLDLLLAEIQPGQDGDLADLFWTDT
jgi:hypothetical protein